MNEASVGQRLVGSWRLLSWEAVGEDGSVEHPMGLAPEGLLAYTAEGTMLVLLARSDRPRHSGSDLTGSTPEEGAEAARSFIAYGGSYEVDGSRVTHRVEMSLFPNWLGSRQVRELTLNDAATRLTLVSPPLELGGTIRSQQLTWERLERR